MKKNAVMFFFKSLLKSILVIVSILAVGMVSYKLSYGFLSKQADEGKLDVREKELKDILDQALTEDISKNLIYVVDDKQNIKNLMLEICNTQTSNIDYITIPVQVEYTIPTAMYQKLSVVDEEIPQVVRISRLRRYFASQEDEKAYGYAELIIEKLLGIKISYYTVISMDIYQNHYQKQEITTSYKIVAPEATSTPEAEATATAAAQSSKGSVTMKVSMLSDAHLNQLKALNGDEMKIKEYIEEQYAQEGFLSNLTVYNKIGYAPVYERSNPDFFHYWGIPGRYDGKLFEVDTASAAKFIKQLQNRQETYAEVQEFGKTVPKKKQISSKKKNILVLNGSKIAGLASSKQKVLTDAGFTVPKVGDYTQEVLTQTRIIVPKKNMGSDLAKYFKNPEVVVDAAAVEEGYDIEIILGTVDAN